MNIARVWIDQIGTKNNQQKSQKYSSVTKKVRFWKIYCRIVLYNVNDKKNNKNVNKNVNNNDSISNRNMRMKKF